MRIDTERGPRINDLGSRLEQRLAGGEQDVAGAVAEGNPSRSYAVAVGQGATQRHVGGIGIAVGAPQHPCGRLRHLGKRGKARLVGGEQSDVVTQVVARGDRVNRDTANPLRKLHGHAA